MKKIYFLTFSIALLLCFVSCNRQTQEPIVLQSAETSDISARAFAERPADIEIEIPAAFSSAESEAPLPSASGGSGPCSIHNELYHSFPDSWIAFVGSEAFYQWIEETSPTPQEKSECALNGACPYAKQNIYSFIHSMNYPKDVFIEQYNADPWVDLRYNIDLLYGDDPIAAEEYYMTTNSALEEMRAEITALRTAKHKLRQAFPDQLAEYVNWKTNSLLEMMETAGVNAADLKDIVSQYEYGTADSIERVEHCDFDAVESLTINERKELMTEHSAFYQDCVLLGITPYETPYEKQVADNAAKLSGHEAS